jgi:hypothetical protein
MNVSNLARGLALGIGIGAAVGAALETLPSVLESALASGLPFWLFGRKHVSSAARSDQSRRSTRRSRHAS